MSRPIQSTRVVPKSKTILERRRAKKDTYLNVTYQLQCLKTLHDELYPSVATNQNSKKSLQKGNVVLYSEGIYDKVMEAFEEETEGEAGEEKMSRFQKGKTDEMPVRTNIKKENDEVDEVEVIVLEDDNVANDEHTVQRRELPNDSATAS
ncbi:hypothetical protein TYRP_001681, partial [Tyrophagus putrescentiae]